MRIKIPFHFPRFKRKRKTIERKIERGSFYFPFLRYFAILKEKKYCLEERAEQVITDGEKNREEGVGGWSKGKVKS